MRKTIIFISVLFGVLTANAQLLSGITTANLNLREKPGKNQPIITTIPKGKGIIIGQRVSDEWTLVTYNKQLGYVYNKCIAILPQEKPDALPLKTKKNSAAIPLSPIKYYTNSQREKVQSPTHYSSIPPGATAICRDGTYSFSHNRRGACSHHGGVAKWLK